MTYIPGLDLNTRIKMEADKAAMGALIGNATTMLAALNVIPKEFAGVKGIADVVGTGIQLFATHLIKEAVAEQAAEQAKAASSGTPTQQSEVVGF